MPTYSPTHHKTDGESHDVCPTCGTHVETKATTNADGHAYRLECPACSWTLPLERPPTTPADDRLRADGGMVSGTRYDTARDRLGELTIAAAERVAAAIDADGERPSAADLRAVLEASNGRIAYLFQHECGVEYVLLDGATIHARTRRTSGEIWPPTTIDTDASLSRRTRKRFDVVARENVPTWVTGGGA